MGSETGARLSIRLFGDLDCLVEGEPMGGLRSRKGEQLLALLVLRGQRAVDRSWLAGLLWPDSPQERASFYLRRELSQLRKALGSQAWRLISGNRDTIRLDLSEADVDVVTFDMLSSATNHESKEAAARCYRGALLESWDEEWLLPERTAREQTFTQLLEELASYELEAGRPAKALPWLRHAIAIEPLRESLHRTLFVTLGQLRDYVALAVAYRKLKAVLLAEIGIKPSDETQDLVRAIRREAQSRVISAPEPESIQTSRRMETPLPKVQPVGREQDEETVIELCRTNRVVMLTGTGGIGKTTLALSVANRLRERHADGVIFVDLSVAESSEWVSALVSRALGLREQASPDAMATIVERLATSDALILLDNCERVSEGVQEFLDYLLPRSPRLRVLATSRHAILAAGAFHWRVPSLETVPRSEWSQRSSVDVERIARASAVQCFLEHAKRSGGNVVLNADRARSIASICHQLDGIPLALELAAARAGSLPLSQIEKNLYAMLPSAPTENGQPASRQSTLKATIDWSIELLTPIEKLLFARLSVFAGGFELEGAIEVCSAEGLNAEQVPEGLASLVQKSLVWFDLEGPGRYRMLEPLKAHAEQLLRDSGETPLLQLRHLAYFFRFVGDLAPELYEGELGSALQALDLELDNIRAAQSLSLAIEPNSELADAGGDAVSPIKFAVRLMRYDYIRGHLEHSRSFALQALERPFDSDLDEDKGWASMAVAICASFQGDLRVAKAMFRKALDFSVASGERMLTLRATQNLGWALFRERDLAAAEDCFLRALGLSRELAEPYWETLNLCYLSGIAAAQEDWPSAERWIGEAVQAESRVKNELITALVLTYRGMVRTGLGQFERAHNDLDEGADMLKRIDSRFHLAVAQYWQAELYVAEGRFDAALTCIDMAIRQFYEMGCELEIAQCFEIRAEANERQGHPELASRWMGVAAAIREKLGIAAPNRRLDLKIAVSASRWKLEDAIEHLSQAGQPNRLIRPPS